MLLLSLAISTTGSVGIYRSCARQAGSKQNHFFWGRGSLHRACNAGGVGHCNSQPGQPAPAPGRPAPDADHMKTINENGEVLVEVGACYLHVSV